MRAGGRAGKRLEAGGGVERAGHVTSVLGDCMGQPDLVGELG